jgi:ADP-ribose pyrophosphatase YjhB (NUDIX family)
MISRFISIFSSFFEIFFTKKKEPIKYVCGFLFSHCGKYVYLIRKKRPGWQAGYLNGVGGRVERAESYETAMLREIYEEAGVKTFLSELVYLEEYVTDTRQVKFYAVLLNKDDIPIGRTDEVLQKVRWMRTAVQGWNSLQVLDNVPYLVNKGYWSVLPFIENNETITEHDKLFPESESLFERKSI